MWIEPGRLLYVGPVVGFEWFGEEAAHKKNLFGVRMAS